MQKNSSKKQAMIQEIQQKTRQYAKRQRTWYKRIENVHWKSSSLSDSKNLDFITDFLEILVPNILP